MFGKLAVALLIAASPAWAQDAAPAGNEAGTTATAPTPVAYKTKKVCRSVEVVGSSIPRTTCTTKRIPIDPPKDTANSEGEPQPQEGAPKNE
jgi:hypothetical protein